MIVANADLRPGEKLPELASCACGKIAVAEAGKKFGYPYTYIECPGCRRVVAGLTSPEAARMWNAAMRGLRGDILGGVMIFEKDECGYLVANIFQDDNTIVEVKAHKDGVYGLTIHTRCNWRSGNGWDHTTAYLKSEHFDMLGSIAHRMRGEQEREERGPLDRSQNNFVDAEE